MPKVKDKPKSSGNGDVSPAEARTKLGLSVPQFASALGVRDYTVERWERGESKPSPLARKAIKLLLRNAK